MFPWRTRLQSRSHLSKSIHLGIRGPSLRLSQTSTAESLSKGVVNTSPDKKRTEFTILLVGETGVGKTSVLSLLYNILKGFDSDHYETANDKKLEAGGSQAQSQTMSAKIYEFKSVNNLKIRILDTPGLADTRGLAQDEIHKETIAKAIQESVVTVNAVLILANGTNPRLGVATDYALTTLSAIFPRTLIDNIGILFTNVSSPLSWNFEASSLPSGLQNATQFLLDNPLALRKKYDEIKPTLSKNPAKLKTLQAAVRDGHRKALEMLADMFNWIDGLEPQATKDIITLYNKSRDMDRSIVNALTRTKEAMDKKQALLAIQAEIDVAKMVSILRLSKSSC
jgi:tRNA U34 5-carboxymethylaminomethyl modifying GTPase MnmE/TrmE